MEHLVPFAYSKNRSGQKVLIFGNGRSGSTVLQHALSPDNKCHDLGEILRRRRKRLAQIDLFKRIFRRVSNYDYTNGHANYQLKKKGAVQVCIHVKPMHVGQEHIASFLNYAKNDGWCIILLFRKPSEVLISAEKAKVTKLWHTKTKLSDNPSITVGANDTLLFPKNVLNKMMRRTTTRWQYNDKIRIWATKNTALICDYNLDLSSSGGQANFSKRLEQKYPEVKADFTTIGLTRNESYPYGPSDLEAMERLEKLELEANGDYGEFLNSLKPAVA